MKSAHNTSIRAMLGILTLAATTVSVPAATWQILGGASAFNVNDIAHWDTGTYPNAPGAVADMFLDYTSNQTVSLNTTITLGQLALGDSGDPSGVGAGDNTMTIQAGTGGSLVFDNGASSAVLNNLSRSQNLLNTISAPILLNSDLVVSVLNQNDQRLVLSGAVTGNRKVTVHRVLGGSAGQMFSMNNSGNVVSELVLGNNDARVTSDLYGVDTLTFSSTGTRWVINGASRVNQLRGHGTAALPHGNATARIGTGVTEPTGNGWKLVAGGTVYPGDTGASPSVGTLTLRNDNAAADVNGALNVWLSEGTLKLDINGDSSHDLLDITNASSVQKPNVTLSSGSFSGTTLALNILGDTGLSVGDKFTILRVEDTQTITGQFANGTSVSAIFGIGIYAFSILYSANLGADAMGVVSDGNDIVLQLDSITIPEPASLVLLALGSLVGLRRRRAGRR